jgi:hypothetical protein
MPFEETRPHGSEPSLPVALPNKPREAYATPCALRRRLWPYRTGHRPQFQDLFLGGTVLTTNLQKVRETPILATALGRILTCQPKEDQHAAHPWSVCLLEHH